MNKLIIPAVIIAIGGANSVARSQAPSPPPLDFKIFYVTPLENDASRIVRLRGVTFPVGGDSGFHRHPGDQWNTIQEGEITLTIKDQAPRTVKPGETAYIPRGTVHRNQNLADKPVRVIELNIIDKDRPDTELVAE